MELQKQKEIIEHNISYFNNKCCDSPVQHLFAEWIVEDGDRVRLYKGCTAQSHRIGTFDFYHAVSIIAALTFYKEV